jgi:ABC transporter ATM
MSFNINNLKKTFLLFTPYIFNNLHSRKRLLWAAGLILVDVTTASLIPYLSKLIIDSLSNKLASGVLILVLLLGFFWIVEKTLSHIQDIIFFPAVNSTIRDLTRDVVKHIHQISLPNYQTLSIPEIINCIRRISLSARSFIKVFFLMIIPTAIKLVITTIVTIKLGVFGLGLLPAILFSGIILYKGSQWYVAAREEAWKISDKMIIRVNDSILNTKITRFFYDQEIQQVNQLLNTEAAFWYKTNTRLHTIHILIGLLLGLAITGILVGGITAIQNHTLTIGDFVLIKGQLLAAFLPMKTLSIEFRQLIESTIDIKKIIQVLEIPTVKNTSNIETYQDTSTENSQSFPHKGIKLNNITFSHSSTNILFKNVSLQILANEKLAIIGESGSGKSSLISLIAGLYKPETGKIFINEQDIHCLPHSELHRNKILHYIPQDLRLFNMSLRDNITYGTVGISENNLLKIAEQVGLMNLINKLPLGLDTVVGEMGANLSGGEKQKVALARALLIKPEILLLDETTHSLDIDCEKMVLENLFLAIPTVIIASHKASTLNHVDRILQVQEGELLEIDISNAIGKNNFLNIPMPA